MHNANPYRAVVGPKSSSFIPGLTSLKGQEGPFTSNSGQINASSYGDLLTQIGRALKDDNMKASMKAAVQNPQVAADRRKILVEAVGDPSGKAMLMLGQAVAAEIRETTDREGFARRVLQYREIGQGESNEVQIKEKDVICFIAVSPSQVTANEVRQRRILPPQFHIGGYILIDTGELSQTTGDLLEEKYEEGLEVIMVQEDRLWKRMADQSVNVRNILQNFSTFTPSVFARIIHQVGRWGIPTTTCLFASDLWQDIIANGDFSGVFDPVTKWELLQEGYLGSMYGITMLTDNFRQPNLKVLGNGELYIVGAPINHGVFTMRGTMTAEPINRYADGEPKKGWFIDQLLSVVMANPMSVAKGQKV
jgi:hypothetical protein